MLSHVPLFSQCPRPPRLMICEDEFLLAIDLQMALEEAGAEVCALAASRAEALALLETVEPDAVVLDIELNDGACVDVAERLAARDIPFIVVTAFDGPRQGAAGLCGRALAHQAAGSR